MEILYTVVMSGKATSLDTEPPIKYYNSIVLQMTFNSVIFCRSEKCWDLSTVCSASFQEMKKVSTDTHYHRMEYRHKLHKQTN